MTCNGKKFYLRKLPMDKRNKLSVYISSYEIICTSYVPSIRPFVDWVTNKATPNHAETAFQRWSWSSRPVVFCRRHLWKGWKPAVLSKKKKKKLQNRCFNTYFVEQLRMAASGDLKGGCFKIFPGFSKNKPCLSTF